MSWLLLRRRDGSLEVELDALVAGVYEGSLLDTFLTRPEAVAAREAQRLRDEREELRSRGKRDLFGEECS